MDSVTVSADYRITIPPSIRECMPLHPGQELVVIARGGIISLVPIPTLEELRGIARGANTEGLRDEHDRV